MLAAMTDEKQSEAYEITIFYCALVLCCVRCFCCVVFCPLSICIFILVPLLCILMVTFYSVALFKNKVTWCLRLKKVSTGQNNQIAVIIVVHRIVSNELETYSS